MPAKDHYEMREYIIDVIDDENDSSFHAKGRPYPIYPSRGALKANFLRDIIPRFVPLTPYLYHRKVPSTIFPFICFVFFCINKLHLKQSFLHAWLVLCLSSSKCRKEVFVHILLRLNSPRIARFGEKTVFPP